MRRPAILAALGVLAFIPASAFAQYGGMGGMGMRTSQDYERLQRSFVMNTTGGNRLIGPLKSSSVTIETEEFGELELPVDSLLGVRLASGDDDEDIVVSNTGEIIKGQLRLETFDIDSGFGPLAIARSKVETIERYHMNFQGMAQFPTLDSVLANHAQPKVEVMSPEVMSPAVSVEEVSPAAEKTAEEDEAATPSSDSASKRTDQAIKDAPGGAEETPRL